MLQEGLDSHFEDIIIWHIIIRLVNLEITIRDWLFIEGAFSIVYYTRQRDCTEATARQGLSK